VTRRPISSPANHRGSSHIGRPIQTSLQVHVRSIRVDTSTKSPDRRARRHGTRPVARLGRGNDRQKEGSVYELLPPVSGNRSIEAFDWTGYAMDHWPGPAGMERDAFHPLPERPMVNPPTPPAASTIKSGGTNLQLGLTPWTEAGNAVPSLSSDIAGSEGRRSAPTPSVTHRTLGLPGEPNEFAASRLRRLSWPVVLRAVPVLLLVDPDGDRRCKRMWSDRQCSELVGLDRSLALAGVRPRRRASGDATRALVPQPPLYS
jgi:hypothetical protein